MKYGLGLACSCTQKKTAPNTESSNISTSQTISICEPLTNISSMTSIAGNRRCNHLEKPKQLYFKLYTVVLAKNAGLLQYSTIQWNKSYQYNCWWPNGLSVLLLWTFFVKSSKTPTPPRPPIRLRPQLKWWYLRVFECTWVSKCQAVRRKSLQLSRLGLEQELHEFDMNLRYCRGSHLPVKWRIGITV